MAEEVLAQELKRRRNWLVLSLVFFMLAVLVFALRLSPDDLSRDRWGLAFFFALFVISEILYVPLPKGGGVSVSFAVVLACLAVREPGVTALVAGVGLVSADALQRRKVGLEAYLFNFGQIALSAYMGGVVFRGLLEYPPVPLALRSTLALIVASLAYFMCNAGLVTLALAVRDGESVQRVWSRAIRGNIPSYLALVPLGVLVALVYKGYGIPGSTLLLMPLLFARYSFMQTLSARKASVSVTQALAAALEAKDAYTKGHSDRVAAYAVEVAKELHLPEDDVEVVRLAAEMHDIGKIGVSEQLLNKPGGLTDSELTEIRKHAVVGANMLQGIEFLKNVAGDIKYHHEWYDGSQGYPRELVGDRIPLGARILMVCDSYDAMTSDRPYRRRIPSSEALSRLKEGAGTQFDPVVVDAFLQVLARTGAAAGEDRQC
ncbi:MAG: HD-GYP domain-containing protein [Chitinophagales bacterium]